LDMDGAFNSVALRLRPGVDAESVITAVDALLGRYGGLGAYARKDQLSNRFLSEELRQLATMARLFPAIFLSVAAFLLNVVMARLIGTQRDQVAVLKAFGYSTGAVSLHYLGMVALIALAGALIGLAGGGLLGHFLAGVYQNFYRFPFLDYGIDRGALFGGIGVSLAAAAAGALQAVRRASALPPAEAMRPPAPPRYRASHLERLGLGRLLATPGRMVMRELERRPWKALLSVVGLALACAIMMVGRFQRDAIDRMVDVHLRLAQQQDWSVDFTEPAGRAALFEIAALPDVAAAEPYRGVAVRLRHGTRSYRTGIEGLPADGVLKRTLDIDLRAWRPPRDGLLLTDYLAEWLGVAPGDRIEVEVLEGRQARLEVPVAAVLPEYIGVQAYMDLDALNHLLGDGEVISGVRLRGASVPPAQAAARDARLVAELERRPRVAGVGARLAAIRSFYETMGESMLVFTFVSLLLGGVINFGVVYNSARIALSERGRELASLRVLGFTRQEVGSILLGELGTLVALATPLGFLAGIGLCWVMSRGFQSDLFRVPVRLAASTYALAALTMLASTLLSAVLVRRRIAQLDLIGVLKTRE
ncbi:MAG TPA: FtsX-like permease family protein, partial [Rhodanobacteraceae bacterium]|nr:FtsX-like permease family protein [Rhodanobacteraceae bacterium]